MSTEEIANPQAESFPGSEFATAREALGLELESLARELHLPVATLQAIEQGELQGLGGAVFVRGYVRSYAKRLKLDPNRYVALCDSCLGVRDKAAPVRVVGTVSTTPARQSRSLVRLGSMVFIIAIIGVVIWWWQTQYSIDSVLSVETDTTVAVDTADGNTLILPAIEDDDPVLESEPLSTSAASDAVAGEAMPLEPQPSTELIPEFESPEPVTAPADSAVPEEAERQADAEPTTAPGLRLVLSEDSWLSIKDGNGGSLYNGIASAGSDLSFDGVAPLSVVIGRASAVSRIEYAGKPVDLSAVSDKNVARLTLSASQP